jgi:hypothetical protein
MNRVVTITRASTAKEASSFGSSGHYSERRQGKKGIVDARVRLAWGESPVARRLAPILGVLMVVGLFMPAVSHAADEKKGCGLFLDSYRELSKVAEFKIALRCGNGQTEQFPISEPLVIGLTATTSAARENDRVEIEYDFAVQNAVVLPSTTAVALTFHAQLADISGKMHAYAVAWPRSFLQDCAGGRSGCKKFGYALSLPASLSKVCVKKDETGETTIKEEFICTGSTDYRFKFR